jgi:hypothetical protein
MNSLILISPYKGSGFKLILSGKVLSCRTFKLPIRDIVQGHPTRI